MWRAHVHLELLRCSECPGSVPILVFLCCVRVSVRVIMSTYPYYVSSNAYGGNDIGNDS